MITPNDYFDEIFCINLNRSVDRWNKVESRFQREGIFVTRWEAIDKLNPKIKNDFIEHTKKTRSRIKKLGRYAVFRSFCSLFEYIVTLNVDKVLIFEDDVLFHKNFKTLFDQQVRLIDPNWKMWYLGSTQVNWRKIDINKVENFYQPNGSTYGMFAVAFRKWFIEQFLDRYSKGLKNNDHHFATETVPEGVFVSWPKICGHDYGWSENAEYEITNTLVEQPRYNYFKYDMNIYH